MTQVYLFDWGNTLMLDDPEQQGKMCDWPEVTIMPGADETLQALSKHHSIYIATNAADSAVADIMQAFERVNLAQYISGCFCRANTGLRKDSPAFYQHIITQLGIPAHSITMIGDTLETDVKPALAAGLKALWFSPEHGVSPYAGISTLNELCNLSSHEKDR